MVRVTYNFRFSEFISIEYCISSKWKIGVEVLSCITGNGSSEQLLSYKEDIDLHQSVKDLGCLIR